MTYDKRPEDTAYRLVNLNTNSEGDFEPFHNDSIFVPHEHVIEVKRGEKDFVIPLPKDEIALYCYSMAGEMVVLPKEVSLARLWLYSTDNPDVLYKVPADLPDFPNSDHNCYFVVPGGTANIGLRGDKYYDAAYQLVRC